jgi:hypothetical protein
MYSIRIQGHLDLSWSAWFDGLTMTHSANGETTLTGPVRDQAALHGILNRLFGLNLTLIGVNRVEPQDTFLGPDTVEHT